MKRIVVVVAFAAIGLAACNGDSDSGTIDTTVPKAATTVAGVTPTTVANGRVPAYLKSYAAATRALTYDQIQFLTGTEAKTAWVKDHPEQPDGPDNDYYIVNVNPQLYTVPVAPGAPITLNVLADGSSSDKPATDEQLREGLTKDGSDIIPFWLTIKDGVITKIEEQFVP